MQFDPSSNKTVTDVEVLLFVIFVLRNHWINILMAQILLNFSFSTCCVLSYDIFPSWNHCNHSDSQIYQNWCYCLCQKTKTKNMFPQQSLRNQLEYSNSSWNVEKKYVFKVAILRKETKISINPLHVCSQVTKMK